MLGISKLEALGEGYSYFSIMTIIKMSAEKALIVTSQGASSCSNFVMSSFAVINFDSLNLSKWCIYVVGALILQGCIRNIFLEPDFSIFGTITKRNFRISILVSFAFPLIALWPTLVITRSNPGFDDLIFIMYSIILLVEDCYRYKLLTQFPRLIVCADTSILFVAICIIMFKETLNLNQLFCLFILAFVEIAIVLYLTSVKISKSFLPKEIRNFTRESYLGLQSLINLVSMLSLNLLVVNYLTYHKLLEYKIIQLALSPIQAAVLLLWLIRLNGYRSSSAHLNYSELKSSIKINMAVFLTFSLIYCYLELPFFNRTDLKWSFYIGIVSIWINAVLTPLNLILRKFELFNVVGIGSAFSGALATSYFFVYKNSLTLISLYLIPLIFQTFLFVIYFAICRKVLRSKVIQSA